MRTLIVVLIAALPLLATPTVTFSTTQVPNVTDGSLDHGSAQFHFSVSEAYDHWRLEYNSTGASCLGTNGGTGGHVQAQTTNGLVAFLDNTAILGGLAGGTTYKVCAKVSQDGGSTYPFGAETTLVTPANPAVMPVPPISPKSFDTSYPDTGTGLTDCPTNSSTGYCILRPATCADVQGAMDSAQFGQTATQGYVIETKHGDVCTAANGLTHGSFTQLTWQQYANDIIAFHASDVTIGSPGSIAVPSGSLSEGMMVTWGRHYGGDDNDPNASGCLDGGTIAGSGYFVHMQDATHINLGCPDKDGNPTSNYLSFSTQGSTIHNLELVPWHAVTGTCPGVSGPETCTYWARNLKKIVFRSDALDSQLPPDGTRIDPSYCAAGFCTTFVDPLSNAGSSSTTGVLFSGGNPDGNAQVMAGAIHIGPGIELTMANDPSAAAVFTNLFATWNNTGDFVFDRVYFHGLGGDQKWGGRSLASGALDGKEVAIVNSYIDNLTSGWSTTDEEGASIIIDIGPGPTIISNNYIEGVGVDIHFSAGAGGGIRGDYSVIRNTFKGWDKWMFGNAADTLGLHYLMRQFLEFKNGRRVRVQGNIFDTMWTEVTPSSVTIAFTSTGEGGNEGYGVTDVDVQSNIFKHVPGITNLPISTIGGNRQTIPPSRFRFKNNLGYDVGNPTLWVPASGQGAPTGWIFEGPGGSSDNDVEHNTIVANSGRSASIATLSTMGSSGVKLTDNFFSFGAGTTGFESDGSVGPDYCCGSFTGEAFATGMMPGNVIAHNVFQSTDATAAQIAGWFPSALNFVPTTPGDYSVNKWMSFSIGNDADYRLRSDSPYLGGAAHPASDRRDVGANMAVLMRETGHIGYVGTENLTATGAKVYWTAPDRYSCPITLLTHTWPITSADTSPKTVSDTETNIGPRIVTITGLTTATHYYGKVQCSVEQPLFDFVTP
jgi:hypothetical protein